MDIQSFSDHWFIGVGTTLGGRNWRLKTEELGGGAFFFFCLLALGFGFVAEKRVDDVGGADS